MASSPGSTLREGSRCFRQARPLTLIGANIGDGCTLVKSGIVKLEVTDKDFAESFDAYMATLFLRQKGNKILVRREAGRLPMYIVKYSSRQLLDLI
jgi:hypothetical protein